MRGMGIALLSLFPEATSIEVKKAKSYMEQYRRAKKMTETFPDRVTAKQKELIADIERSIALILDEDVRKIIEYRYVRGNSHKVTIGHYTGAGWSERTIDRKIEEGLESIANTLVFCGQLEQNEK